MSLQPRRFLTCAIACLVVAGCAKQPGGQVVAVVGDEEITLTELRAEARTPPNGSGPEVEAANRSALTRLVDRNLLAEFARKQGLDRSPDFVARRRQIEQSLLAALAVRKLSGAPPKPSGDEVRRYIEANAPLFAQRQRLMIDRIRIATPSDKSQIQALVDLQDLGAAERRLASQGIKFERNRGIFDTASVVPAVSRQIVALPNGEVFDLSIDGSTYISTIVERKPAISTPASWTAAATAILTREKVAKRVEGELDKLRKATKIDFDAAYRPKPATS